MAKERIGSGARFRGLEAQFAGRRGIRNPAGLAAFVGRQKYGKKRFQALAAEGRRRAKDADRDDAPPRPPRRVRL